MNTSKPKTIKSHFAILDVLSARKRRTLQKAVTKEGGLPVVIRGRLVEVHGNHDGVSQEYEVEVENVEVGP